MHAGSKTSIVKILLKLPDLDTTLTDDEDLTAFHRACRKGWTKVVTAMVRSNRALKQLTMEDLKQGEFLAKDSGYKTTAEIVSKAASVRDRKTKRKQETG